MVVGLVVVGLVVVGLLVVGLLVVDWRYLQKQVEVGALGLVVLGSYGLGRPG